MTQPQESKIRVYPGPHRAAFELWKAGFDLQQIYPRATYFRHKRYFRERFGLDIGTPPNGGFNAKSQDHRSF